MRDKFFLDTNIFVYSFDERAKDKSGIAAKLIRDAIDTRKGIVSYQVVQEFFNLALRRFPKPMGIPEAKLYLETVFRPLMAVHSSERLYHEAIRLQGEHRLAWYDAIIAAAAIASECAVLYSEDFQHGRHFGTLQVRNPFD